MSDKPETFEETLAIGLPKKNAEMFFEDHGYTMRVTRNNGQACIVTRDYKLNRINVGIENGIVTEIRGVG